MTAEEFIEELRSLPPKEAIARALEVTRDKNYAYIIREPVFHEWLVGMDAAGHIDWK